jgi:hypothetical protein
MARVWGWKICSSAMLPRGATRKVGKIARIARRIMRGVFGK